MIPVSRHPIGLLSLIDSKATGAAPAQMGDAYIGTIDVTDLLALQLRDRVTGAAAADALGTQLFLTVPANEVWLIHEACIALSAAAAITSHRACLCMANSAGGTTAVSDQFHFVTSGAGLFLFGFLPKPLWLKPGERFGLVNLQLDAQTTDVNISASVSRFSA
jgi:hypothetical protein